MNRLIAMVLAGVLVGIFTISGAQAQVGIDVGGGVSGSIGQDGTDSSMGADASVDVGNDTPVSSEDETDTSDTNISVSVSQDYAASASLDAESAERSASSVSTSKDLSVYATSKMKRDAMIESVVASNDRISLKYRKSARFLGIIPGSIRATVEVESDGSVDIDYPWYRFLFAVEGSDNAEAELEAQVRQIMVDAHGTLTARVEAELLDVMHSALSGPVVVSADTATTADTVGSGGVESSTDAESSDDIYPQ
ncbi:MAG TPA: hypothetical protein VJA87_01275 [Candidatus Paceibacterota bacterium]